MRSAAAVILGIALVYAGMSKKKDIFYSIRGVRIRGIGVPVLRIIYVLSGIMLALAAFSGII